jgi:hypothetical protein
MAFFCIGTSADGSPFLSACVSVAEEDLAVDSLPGAFASIGGCMGSHDEKQYWSALQRIASRGAKTSTLKCALLRAMVA